ncbi:GNAT family N-acetyltransferase [Tumebacillus algifaecis]|nr:GNAT family N-acetyltransferase [Tumebacillus algifaecis]
MKKRESKNMTRKSAKKASGRVASQPQPVARSKKSAPRSAHTLHFRPREDHDNSFISRITLLTLKKVFEESTKSPLTEQIVLHLVNQTDHVVIVEQAGKPIGYYCYDKTGADSIYWGSLVLEPVKQAKGLGKKVLEHFVTEARKQGVREINGHVQVKNKEAYKFWMNNGFQVVGREDAGSLPIQLRLD